MIVKWQDDRNSNNQLFNNRPVGGIKYALT